MNTEIPPHIRQWSGVRCAADDIRDAAVLRLHGDQSTKSFRERDAHAAFLRLADALGYDVLLRSAEEVV